MSKIYIKNANSDISNELSKIGFDSSYLDIAKLKYTGSAYKIFNLKPYEANILKQLCLSLGFDCAVSRETVMCKCDTTDALIFASDSQLRKLVQKLGRQPFRLKNLSIEIEKQLTNELSSLDIRATIFDWKRPYIMGILNVTPDSFSDGGRYNSVDSALKHCKQMIAEGADIIDIGGESTRPDALEINVDEEIERVVPIINAIRKSGIEIPISIDTRNYRTAKASIEAGADIINDVSGLDYDDNLLNYVVENNLPVIIMHSDKVPAVSSDYTSTDIVEDIYFYLKNKIDTLISLGLERKNIIIDVGIGFGKSIDSNFELLKRQDEFLSLKCPILLGLSRKSFMRKTFDISCIDSDIPTALYSAMLSNINIHRVHNVALTKKYLEFASKIL